jgi:hypothetical protein
MRMKAGKYNHKTGLSRREMRKTHGGDPGKRETGTKPPDSKPRKKEFDRDGDGKLSQEEKDRMVCSLVK